MKKFLLFIFFNCALCIVNCQSCFAQNPLVKMWDKRFGGSDEDYLTSFRRTFDKGYILGGSSLSGASGDKLGTSRGWWDYWIVKIDSQGIKQWDKTFGGSSADELFSVIDTKDGGYLLGGRSSSGNNGDRSEPSWGSTDYWIVKIDSSGIKMWDKRYGGFLMDDLHSVVQTSDDGYILGGSSDSGVGGDKTEPVQGAKDYWVVKIDSNGTKQWDKRFGGIDDDILYSIQQINDGGYLLGGSSLSNISGDKTQTSFGSEDYWIVKIDSIGTKQWDKTFGGADQDWCYSLLEDNNGGYFVGGISYSNISGNKTEPTFGLKDYWFIKIDSTGTKDWERAIGASSLEDDLGNIFQTLDSGYLISGSSYSQISGLKTESNLGIEQSWIVKLNKLGSKEWDKTIFTNGHDESGISLQLDSTCYTIANLTNSGIGGYKTQTSRGGYDFWIVKFCDSTFLPPTATALADSFLCPGTCANFINLSFNATAYQWSFSGATPDTSTDVNPQNICYANPGNYSVQLIATNANGSDTLLLTNYITVYPTPSPQSITQSGDSLFAISGAPSYQWYFNGNLINGATNYFYVAQSSGDYNVVATDVNGCEVEAAIFNVIASTQFSKSEAQISVYPNPVEDKLFVKSSTLSGTASEISIYNFLGEKIIFSDESQIQTIDCKSLKPGIYFIEINSGEKIFRSKFVKATYR